TAPTMAPDTETVRAAWPAQATAAFNGSAISRTDGAAAASAMASPSLTHESAHSTDAAVSGTERLSSSLIGTVSTAAAASAAMNGAPSENQRYGGGISCGRHHQARNAPAAPPTRKSATDPGMLF